MTLPVNITGNRTPKLSEGGALLSFESSARHMYENIGTDLKKYAKNLNLYVGITLPTEDKYKTENYFDLSGVEKVKEFSVEKFVLQFKRVIRTNAVFNDSISVTFSDGEFFYNVECIFNRHTFFPLCDESTTSRYRKEKEICPLFNIWSLSRVKIEKTEKNDLITLCSSVSIVPKTLEKWHTLNVPRKKLYYRGGKKKNNSSALFC